MADSEGGSGAWTQPPSGTLVSSASGEATHGDPTASPTGAQPPGRGSAPHENTMASPARAQPPWSGSASHGDSTASLVRMHPLGLESAPCGYPAASSARVQPPWSASASHGDSAASSAGVQPPWSGSASPGDPVASSAGVQPPWTGSTSPGDPVASSAGVQPPCSRSAPHGYPAASKAVVRPPGLGSMAHGYPAASSAGMHSSGLGCVPRGYPMTSSAGVQPPGHRSAPHGYPLASSAGVQPLWSGSALHGYPAVSSAGVQPPWSGSAPHGDPVASSAGAQPHLPCFEAFGKLWEVQARLGTGSSATVFQVSTGTGTPATAVKEFQSDPQNGEYGFRKESSTLEDLQGHKNIVALYGVFTNHLSVNGPTRCLLLELLDVSVSELLLHASHQGCSMWTLQHCARDVLQALAFIHREGYIHADLKPRNILWSGEEECFKLIDFGLSFKDGNQDVKYIQTEGYRAPEAELQNFLSQAGLHSDLECTSAVDLWSLGIVLLEMYSGMKLKHAVRSQEWKANNSAMIDHIFASKRVVNAAIPAYHLRDLIKSMLQDDPRHRITAEKALCSPFFSIPFAPHIEDLVMLPTPVLRLLNVLDERCLQLEEEYEDVVEDMREECQKYGPVVSLFVPKENPGRGQVLVEYANAGDSKAARKMLSGRIFEGRFVVATFYPLSAYKKGYLYQTLL